MEREKHIFFESDKTGITPEEDVQCLVFRTNLQNRKDVEKIAAVLDNIAGISDWYVDLDDWEKVLRIESRGLSADGIIKTLFNEGVIAETIPTDIPAKEENSKPTE